MDAHRNLGGLRLFCEKRGGGGGGVGVAGRFWGGGGGGLAQKEKSPDFRCPEVGISDVCCLATMLDFTNLGSGETTPSVTLSTLPNVPFTIIHDGG